jgi:hypothetical protein
VLTPPFAVSDRGDVYVYDDAAALYGGIEALDAPDINLFDATGRPLRVLVEDYTWRIDEDRIDPPEPERLVSILRTYFERLPEKFAAYRERAAETSNVADLLILRQELAREPAPGTWAKLIGRSWG